MQTTKFTEQNLCSLAARLLDEVRPNFLIVEWPQVTARNRTVGRSLNGEAALGRNWSSPGQPLIDQALTNANQASKRGLRHLLIGKVRCDIHVGNIAMLYDKCKSHAIHQSK